MGADKPVLGSIGWTDLTVVDAESVRDFYAAVVGWNVEPVDLEGYQDFTMIAPDTGDAVAGVCHARGPNADLPAQWLVYITVADVDTSVERCQELGGQVVAGPKGLAGGRFAVIQDPAGAVCALYEPPS
jgi:predicted enzyme related to lactoylglutathione lyase